MQLTDHEEKLLLRALDAASAPAEAEKAAQALIESLRQRGISGYDVLADFARRTTAAQQSHATAEPIKRGWGVGPGYWSKNPDGSTRWTDDLGRVYPFPPNPRMDPERAERCRHAQEEAARRYAETQRYHYEQRAKKRPWWHGGIYDWLNELDNKRSSRFKAASEVSSAVAANRPEPK